DGFTVVADHQHLPTGDPVAAADKDHLRITLSPFNLHSDVISFFGTYGITDRWDVNVLLPVVHTSLEVGRTDQLIEPRVLVPGDGPYHGFGPNHQADSRTIGPFSNDATGIGDLLLRTKYRFLESHVVDLASALVLRVPTGDQNDFQGTGDVTLTPSLILSHTFGLNDVHAQFSIDADASNVDASRGRWGLGTSIQPVEGVAVVLDFLGSSGLTQDTLSESVTHFKTKKDFTEVQVLKPVSTSVRTDLVDVSFGFKWNVYK